MKPIFIVANFKSNKTKNEAREWLNKLLENKLKLQNLGNKKIIICPPFTLLDFFKTILESGGLSVELGAQDISRFPSGQYTGEVNGEQVKEFVNYVLIGHSERRKSFSEDERIIEEKIKMAKDYNLTPILCVQNSNNKIYSGVSIVAYEPQFAIGTGNADDPKNAEKIALKIKEKGNVKVLYGGSVTPENIKSFTQMSNIDGVLIGNAALTAEEFLKLIENA